MVSVNSATAAANNATQPCAFSNFCSSSCNKVKCFAKAVFAAYSDLGTKWGAQGFLAGTKAWTIANPLAAAVVVIVVLAIAYFTVSYFRSDRSATPAASTGTEATGTAGTASTGTAGTASTGTAGTASTGTEGTAATGTAATGTAATGTEATGTEA